MSGPTTPTIAPKISAMFPAVLVGDNEPVKAAISARIADRNFRVTLDQARADLDAASAAIATGEASIQAQHSAIAAARAAINVDAANLTFANQDDRALRVARGLWLRQRAKRPVRRPPVRRRHALRSSATKAALEEVAVSQVGVLKAELAAAGGEAGP